MITITKRFLSGSTNGKAIKVTGTSTGASVTIHTATAVSTDGEKDEIWIFAHNTGTDDKVLTLEWGSTSTDDNIVTTVPAVAGLTCIIPGFILNNTLVVKAFSSTANDIRITGYVNRITET